MLSSADGKTSGTAGPGQSASHSLQVNPLDGFAGSVDLSCPTNAPGASCAAAPATVATKSAPAAPFTVTVTLGGSAPPAAYRLGPPRAPGMVGVLFAMRSFRRGATFAALMTLLIPILLCVVGDCFARRRGPRSYRPLFAAGLWFISLGALRRRIAVTFLAGGLLLCMAACGGGEAVHPREAVREAIPQLSRAATAGSHTLYRSR